MNQPNQTATTEAKPAHVTDEEILQHHSPAVMQRARIELRIVRRTLRDLIKAGYGLTIDDGEEQTPYTNEGEALKLLFDLDEAYVYTKQEGKKDSFVRFVFGNDGWDVVCDYGMSIDPIMEKISQWADKAFCS